jgi:hypothetical protein
MLELGTIISVMFANAPISNENEEYSEQLSSILLGTNASNVTESVTPRWIL